MIDEKKDLNYYLSKDKSVLLHEFKWGIEGYASLSNFIDLVKNKSNTELTFDEKVAKIKELSSSIGYNIVFSPTVIHTEDGIRLKKKLEV